MAAEFASKLENLNATQAAINDTQKYFISAVHSTPNIAQELVGVWLSALESKSHKIALLYLANDIIQNDRHNKVIKRMFALVIPKAISFIAANPRNMEEIRKILGIWGQRRVFSTSTLVEWNKQ